MTIKPMWTEGLFLMPQHLQLLDTYHERLLDKRVSMLGSYMWGLSEIEVDAEQLARGIFRLSRCGAVMPDGLLVELGEDHEVTGATAMTGGKLAGGGHQVDVLLAVPSMDAGGVSPEGGAGMRYLQQSQSCDDAMSSADAVEIDCVVPNVQLLLGSDKQASYVTIKVAELTVAESGRLAVNPTYIPPLLRVRASDVLQDRLSRLVNALAAKQKTLVGRYGDREVAMVEFGAADMATFWYLHTVNTWLPIFMHHADSGEAHPEQLYLALAAFTGQLSTFEATADPIDVPRFNFLDLRSTFMPLFDRIFDLLGTVVSSRFRTIPLEQTQPGLFVGKVEDPNLLSSHNLYLLAAGDLDEQALRDDVPRYLKVGAIDQISRIVQSALPGVGTRIDLTPPSALPVRAHVLYMRLDKAGRYWEGIKQSGTIAIYQPVKPSKVKLELLAVEA